MNDKNDDKIKLSGEFSNIPVEKPKEDRYKKVLEEVLVRLTNQQLVTGEIVAIKKYVREELAKDE